MPEASRNKLRTSRIFSESATALAEGSTIGCLAGRRAVPRRFGASWLRNLSLARSSALHPEQTANGDLECKSFDAEKLLCESSLRNRECNRFHASGRDCQSCSKFEQLGRVGPGSRFRFSPVSLSVNGSTSLPKNICSSSKS